MTGNLEDEMWVWGGLGGCREGGVGAERVGWREGVSEWRGGEKDGIRQEFLRLW